MSLSSTGAPAEVSDGTLSVEITGEFDDDWEQTFAESDESAGEDHDESEGDETDRRMTDLLHHDLASPAVQKFAPRAA
jgi:hypothetical protein